MLDMGDIQLPLTVRLSNVLAHSYGPHWALLGSINFITVVIILYCLLWHQNIDYSMDNQEQNLNIESRTYELTYPALLAATCYCTVPNHAGHWCLTV